ncbi:MAG: argininosuccinate lyase [Candidatus Poribacteria bacterium]|nr:argininosuccinate lyase [Candidatus Poribacteria bacterium]MDE0504268.1 argininosuccinate lyase [Candidatus Poribacteria bacterium]
MSTTPSKKLWGGRFRSEVASGAQGFTQSTEIDSRLVAYDIWGSQAHAIMLARAEIISDEDLRQILTWLDRAQEDYDNGIFNLKPDKEDVHMNVESYVIDGAGIECGGKLHTARSRNDQVLVDAHLYVRDQILQTQSGLTRLCRVFLGIASNHAETVMPGYTHMQHAQPISLGFWATAYVSMFLRDLKRLKAAFRLANMNPLGACAIAGTSFSIDRHLTTKLLGFDSVHRHALDVISSRDFIAETLFALSLLMTNLSRLGEETIYWTTHEFGIAVLDDAYATGSSIMPQKKNPDIAELVRGRCGRVYGELLDLLTNLKGLPLGYNRDLQEDKPPLWDAFDVVQSCLNILPGFLETTRFNTDRMAELCNANFATATELANFLVREYGIPFRECHEIVGGIVGDLVKKGATFEDLDETRNLLQLRGICLSTSELRAVLDSKHALRGSLSLGGTSPAEVQRMTSEFGAELADIDAQILLRKEEIDVAYNQTHQIIEEVAAGRAIARVDSPCWA